MSRSARGAVCKHIWDRPVLSLPTRFTLTEMKNAQHLKQA